MEHKAEEVWRGKAEGDLRMMARHVRYLSICPLFAMNLKWFCSSERALNVLFLRDRCRECCCHS